MAASRRRTSASVLVPTVMGNFDANFPLAIDLLLLLEHRNLPRIEKKKEIGPRRAAKTAKGRGEKEGPSAPEDSGSDFLRSGPLRSLRPFAGKSLHLLLLLEHRNLPR